MRRLVALGASNLTRGLADVVSTGRAVWGDPLAVLAADGHGRSYGSRSRFLVRERPGLLQCGLWGALAEDPPVPTTAFVTDIGNDLLYGFRAETLLGWVDECLTRLTALGARVVLTDLPAFNAQRLSETGFVLFRTVVVPSSRVSLRALAAGAVTVNAGLGPLAERHGATLVHLRPEWYGLDPLHILPRHWQRAWQSIVLAGTGAATAPLAGPPRSRSLRHWLRLYLARPEQRWLCGLEQHGRQPALRFDGGTTLSLY